MTDETDLGAGEYIDDSGVRWRREHDAATGKWHTYLLEPKGATKAEPPDEAADQNE